MSEKRSCQTIKIKDTKTPFDPLLFMVWAVREIESGIIYLYYDLAI